MNRTRDTCVLAIDPATRGFGFAVMESPRSLLDWGVQGTRQRTTAQLLHHIVRLIEAYAPDVIVIEEYDARVMCQRRRAYTLLRALEPLASRKGIRVRRITKATLKRAFSRARNKDHVAALIAGRLPVLVPWLPRMRKQWMTEQYRMSIFDAVAMALAFFDGQPKRPPPESSGGVPYQR